MSIFVKGAKLCGRPLFKEVTDTSHEEMQDEQKVILFPRFLQSLEMSKKCRDTLRMHFRKTLLEQRPDVFHKVMLMCMQSSPKMNEVIACQMYCYRDLTKWPKLNSLCTAQKSFFTQVIEELHLDGAKVAERAFRLGEIHFKYAQYGMKPHFLDIFALHMETILRGLKFSNDDEKQIFILAFRQLNAFIAETMSLAYSKCQQRAMIARR
ncbi:hypothetical protein Aduo_017023 [Ancylostoma duodenale]